MKIIDQINPTTDSRKKLMYIDPELIVNMLQTRCTASRITSTIISNLEQGTTFVSVYYEKSKECFGIVLHNPAWPKLQQGEIYPIYVPTIKSTQLTRNADGLWEEVI